MSEPKDDKARGEVAKVSATKKAPAKKTPSKSTAAKSSARKTTAKSTPAKSTARKTAAKTSATSRKTTKTANKTTTQRGAAKSAMTAAKPTAKPKITRSQSAASAVKQSHAHKNEALYVISHRLTDIAPGQERHDACGRFAQDFDKHLAGKVDLLATPPATTERRQVRICRADPAAIREHCRHMDARTIIEPLLQRRPHVATPLDMMLTRTTNRAAGSGDRFEVTLLLDSGPGNNAPVTLVLSDRSGETTQVGGVSDADGKVSIAYDAAQWSVAYLLVQPRRGAWNVLLQNPASGLTLHLIPLPETGPLGWRHHLSGLREFDRTSGAGVKVGVVDTGCGPHADLAHLHHAGAFINGAHDTSAKASHDVRNHGTHVAGLITGLPEACSGAYGGFAPGAEVHAARVFTTEGGGNQGDIAAAIDHLAQQMDLINLSFGDGAPSQIEDDAIAAALGEGAVCIVSAGNNHGGAVTYPAAYPDTYAVSALGLWGAEAACSTAAWNRPARADRIAADGRYLTAISSTGPHITLCAPGNGLIATAPDEGYVAMDGTSMAAAVTTGALAQLMGRLPHLADIPRAQRPTLVGRLVQTYARTLGLHPSYQGLGQLHLT